MQNASFPPPSLVHARCSKSIQIMDFSTQRTEMVNVIGGEHGRMYEVGCVIRKCNFGYIRYVMELELVQNHWTRSNRVYAAKCINVNEYLENSKKKNIPEDPLSEIACYQYIAKLGGHPHIISLVDALILHDWYVAIMEYAPEGDLLSKVQLDGVIPPDRMPRYVSMACSALSFLHEHNICHRDLSTENVVYFAKSDTIKLVDFGMAFKFPDVGLCSPPPIIFGKRPYLAPEICRRVDFYPPPVDMWAVGVICFVCLVNRLPVHGGEMFQGVPLTDALLMHSMQLVLQENGVTLPEEALSFIENLLREYPEQRLTAQQVLEHAWLQNL